MGRYREAEPLYERALAGSPDPEQPFTIRSEGSLAAMYFEEATFYELKSFCGVVQLQLLPAVARKLSSKVAEQEKKPKSSYGANIRGSHEGGIPTETKEELRETGKFARDVQTAQWALSSEAAQSLAQMAARGAMGDPG